MNRTAILAVSGLGLCLLGTSMLLLGQYLGALAYEAGRQFAVGGHADVSLQTWGRFYSTLMFFPLLAGCALMGGGMVAIGFAFWKVIGKDVLE